MSSSITEKSRLITHSTTPVNAEPPLPRLRQSMITAQADFYVRSHGGIPNLDHATHQLWVDGLVRTPLNLSLDQRQTGFINRRIVAVMQCAGNRRADMQQVGKTLGDPWAGGAIGNAEWTGVAVADVLQAAGADSDGSLHVAFEASDTIEVAGEAPFNYGVSIPMTKAMSPDVLLA